MSRVRVSIRVDLDSEGFRDLELVKEFLRLKNYSEVLRYLIGEKAREIKALQAEENVTPVTAEEVGG